MIAFIDNKDSFTFNIVQSLERVSGGEVRVFRSGECSVEDVEAAAPAFLVVGPGPGSPEQAGISVEAVRHFAGKIPVLGICLGHQAIGAAFGAKVVQARFVRHGIVEEMATDGRGLFRALGRSGKFTRYHSLALDEATLPAELEVTARAADGEVMGVRHKTMVVEGVQFHPESIASEGGDAIFRAFLNYRRDNMNHAAFLGRLVAKDDLSEDEAALFMESVTDGTMDERVMAAVLVAMSAKGIATSEMTGCARALLRKKTPFPLAGVGLAEIVGTGGDGKGSFNISSLSALCAASCGQPMAKHGNRAVSSKSGAADFFEAMEIKIDGSPEKTAELVRRTGFGFLMAPVYHSAMRFAAPVRKVLGVKTIFNILGPLLNPAGAEYEVLGVYSRDLLADYARAAKALGAKRVMVVASEDGYDEISPCSPTHVYQIDERGRENRYAINPADFGIAGANEAELLGGDGAENARLAMDVLEGRGRAAIRAAVGLNAAAVLYLCGKARTLKEGYAAALEALDSGRTLAKVREIQEASREL